MKVIYAVLSSGQQVFHPALAGALKGTLNTNSYKGIEMTLMSQGLLISYKERMLVVPMHKFEFVEIESYKDAKKSTK